MNCKDDLLQYVQKTVGHKKSDKERRFQMHTHLSQTQNLKQIVAHRICKSKSQVLFFSRLPTSQPQGQLIFLSAQGEPSRLERVPKEILMSTLHTL